MLAKEGQEIARRLGSRGYGFLMVGNGIACAVRTGEWEWADAQLEHWLADVPHLANVIELLVDRAILAALRGADASAELDAVGPELEALTDPQYQSYYYLGRAWSALSEGRMADAVTAAERAAAATSYFRSIALPVAARAALWAGDAERARSILATIEGSGLEGEAFDLDRGSIRAGLLALDGRAGEALAAYRDVLRRWRAMKLPWDEALTAIDMASLLGSREAEVRSAAESARGTLTRLGAMPFLARLEERLARPTGASAPAATTTTQEAAPVG